MANIDKGQAIDAALANIEKKFGKGSIMRLGERPVESISAISTGSISLDAARLFRSRSCTSLRPGSRNTRSG